MFKQRGLSLIELMIALIIGLVLMLGVTQVFLSTRNVYSNQDAVARVQETGRLAMEFITRDTRMAGYTGCASGALGAASGVSSTANLIPAPTPLNKIDVGVEGIDNSSAVPAGYQLNAPARVAATDVLVVRAAQGTGIPLTSANTANSISIDATAPDAIEAGACTGNVDRVNGICPNDILVVANCERAAVFIANNITNAGVITPSVALTSGLFDTDSEIITTVNTIIYYVAVSPTTNRRGLWQKVGGNPAVELLEGVENMQLEYGLDTGTDGVVDVYRTAAGIPAASWPKVSSVRVNLLVRSIDNNVTPNPQPYNFYGAAVAPVLPDRFLRQAFVSTIGIRGRLK